MLPAAQEHNKYGLLFQYRTGEFANGATDPCERAALANPWTDDAELSALAKIIYLKCSSKSVGPKINQPDVPYCLPDSIFSADVRSLLNFISQDIPDVRLV